LGEPSQYVGYPTDREQFSTLFSINVSVHFSHPNEHLSIAVGRLHVIAERQVALGSRGKASMRKEEIAQMENLCRLIAVEKDPKKFNELVAALNDLFEDKNKRLEESGSSKQEP